MSTIPAFVPLPYKTAEELVEAFDAGVKFRLASPHTKAPEPVLRLIVLGSKVAAFGPTQSWNFFPDGNCCQLGDYGAYRLIHVDSNPAATAPASDRICASDRPGIAATPRAAEPTPAPTFYAKKHDTGGLLTVWAPRSHL